MTQQQPQSTPQGATALGTGADATWPSDATNGKSLDDLLDEFNANPSGYSHKLFVMRNRGGMQGRSIPAVELTPGMTRDEVEAACRRHLDGPTYLICKMRQLDGQGKGGRYTAMAEIDLSDPAWFAAPRAAGAPPAAAAPPPAPPLPVMGWPQQQLPPTDVLSLVMAQSAQMQQVLLTLLQQQNQPRVDPSVEVLREQLRAVSAQLETLRKEPVTRDKAERDEWRELVKAATAGSGGMEAAATLLAGPLDKVASAMAATVETRAQIEKTNAEVKAMEAAAKLEEAEARKLLAAGGANVEPAAPSAAKQGNA